MDVAISLVYSPLLLILAVLDFLLGSQSFPFTSNALDRSVIYDIIRNRSSLVGFCSFLVTECLAVSRVRYRIEVLLVVITPYLLLLINY